MFTLDLTTGSITNAIKHLMNDPCPGKLEVAIHSNESRSVSWLLVRWGRCCFITLPVPNEDKTPGEMVKWFECRDADATLYSGKKWFSSVTIPVEPERAAVREVVTTALDILRGKLRKNEDAILDKMMHEMAQASV